MSLIHVKVGDRVVICGGGDREIAEIVRVTDKDFYTTGGVRYLKRNGKRWGRCDEVALEARPDLLVKVEAEIAKRSHERQQTIEDRRARERLDQLKGLPYAERLVGWLKDCFASCAGDQLAGKIDEQRLEQAAAALGCDVAALKSH